MFNIHDSLVEPEDHERSTTELFLKENQDNIVIPDNLENIDNISLLSN